VQFLESESMNNTWRKINEAWKKTIYARCLRTSDSIPVAGAASAIAIETATTVGGTTTGESATSSVSGRGIGCVKTSTVESTSTYIGADDDFYIGVASDKASTIYLPAAAANGKLIIVKAEMRPPIGTRKIQIATTDGSTIDGYDSTSIRISYGSLVLIRNNNNWFVIS
jgi:hypothetical protein